MKRIPGVPNREEIIEQYTNGRTDSLKEMTRGEYDRMCDELDAKFKDPRTRARSIALGLMQDLGINTRDWNRINDFCRDSRIAGKVFADLSAQELGDLATKLRGIQRKGGLRSWAGEPQKPTQPEPAQAILFEIPFGGLPS